MILADFTPKSKFVSLDRSDLVEVVPGIRFQTPHKFDELSVSIAVQGQTIGREEDNGFLVIDNQTIEFKESVPALFFIRVSYMRG